MSEPRPRVGVWRRTCPHPVAATAEARVVHHELARRLGELTLDLRVEGDLPVGAWAPLPHAAWPADVDAVVEPSELFGDRHPPLTALYARTVDPHAADVRRRMLAHLGLIEVDGGPVDDDTLAELGSLSITPTDLWLVVTSATSVTVSDDGVAAFATSTDADRADLDAAFDAVAARLGTLDLIARSAARALARTRAELDDLRAERDELADRLARERAEAETVIDELAGRVAARHVDGDRS